MSLQPVTTTFGTSDRRWCASHKGTDTRRSITLDVSTFNADIDYPDGRIPSGTPLGKITASGKYGKYVPGNNEAQLATITGTPTGGTFTLTFSGQTTGAIAYNASAATVQAALVALSNIAPGDVTVTGSAGGPYTVTFAGAYAHQDVPAMTATPSLTGGSSPSVTITTPTAGDSAAASNGQQTAAGFLADDVRVVPRGTTVAVTAAIGSLQWEGVVTASALPSNAFLDAAAKSALTPMFRFE